MAHVSWSAEAKDDLADIVAYYENRSEEYGRALVRQLYEAVSRLEHFPHMGRIVPELGLESFRELIVAGYRVVYLVRNEAVDIFGDRTQPPIFNQKAIPVSRKGVYAKVKELQTAYRDNQSAYISSKAHRSLHLFLPLQRCPRTRG